MFVTRLGRTHYCCVTSADELQDWMRWLRTALDMALGTQGVGIEDPHVAGVSISREALHRGVLEPPKPSESEVIWVIFVIPLGQVAGHGRKVKAFVHLFVCASGCGCVELFCPSWPPVLFHLLSF